MELNVGKELASLNRMPVPKLRAKYAEVFGESTNTRHKAWLVKRIIWRMQAFAVSSESGSRGNEATSSVPSDLHVATGKKLPFSVS